MKNTKGITLIALVITIIVLLILAGISVSMLSGENSILSRTTEAKNITENKTIVENIRIELLGKNVENQGRLIKESQLVEILKKYFNEDEVDALEIPEDVSMSNAELTSKQGNYRIKLSDIYNGQIIPTWVYNHSRQTVKKGTLEFNIGDKINYVAPSGSGYSGDWQVLGVGVDDEDGQLLLVSEGMVNNGNKKTLKGADYATPGGNPLIELQGAIDELDEVCKTCKNENATKARSLRVEDINRLTGFDPNNAYLSNSDINKRGNIGQGGIAEYENIVTYKIGSSGEKVGYKYGTMEDYSTENVKNSTKSFIPWGCSTSIEAGVDSEPIKCNAYSYYINTLSVHISIGYTEPGLRSNIEEGYENSNAAYNMIRLNNEQYWLASIYSLTKYGVVEYGLFKHWSEGMIGVGPVWDTRSGSSPYSNYVRAVVSIKPDAIVGLKQ